MKFNIKDFEKLYHELLGYTRHQLIKANKCTSYSKDILQDLYIEYLDKEFNDFLHLKRSAYLKIRYSIIGIFRGKSKYSVNEILLDNEVLVLTDNRKDFNKGYENVYIESELNRIPGKQGVCLKYLYEGYTEEEIRKKTRYYCTDDYIEEGKRLMKIEELRTYLYSLNKYDVEVIESNLQVIGKDKTVDYIQLRPNGCTSYRSNGADLDKMKDRNYAWGEEWILIEHEESLEKHKKSGKPE